MIEISYHPDPEINASVAAEALEAERIDLSVGYLPRRWICSCGSSHERGHFMEIGVHRCLSCGYVGDGGIMVDRIHDHARAAFSDNERR